MCFAALAHSLVVMFPEVSVSALARHVEHCEGKTTRREEKCIKHKIMHHICSPETEICNYEKVTDIIFMYYEQLPGCLELLYAEANGGDNVLCLSLKNKYNMLSNRLSTLY